MLNQLEPEDKHWLNIMTILANVVLSYVQKWQNPESSHMRL